VADVLPGRVVDGVVPVASLQASERRVLVRHQVGTRGDVLPDDGGTLPALRPAVGKARSSAVPFQSLGSHILVVVSRLARWPSDSVLIREAFQSLTQVRRMGLKVTSL
jgi:hypothetical protein